MVEAVVKLTRAASDRYLYNGHFAADVVQACVVTLEPVPAHLEGDFERTFRLAPVAHGVRRGRKPFAGNDSRTSGDAGSAAGNRSRLPKQ